MTDYNSDSDDSFDFDHWDSDVEAESSSALALRSPDAPGPSMLVPQDANDRAIGAATSDSLIGEFVRMGFPEEMVLKAIKDLKGTDENELLNLLLAYQDNDGEAESSSALALRSPDAPGTSMLVPQDANDRAIGAATSESLVGEFVRMGFPEEMVLKGIKHLKGTDENELLNLLLAYQYVGNDAPLGNCSTSGCAPQSVGEDDAGDSNIGNWDDRFDAGGREPEFRGLVEIKKKRKRCASDSENDDHEDLVPLPNAMVGFSLPNDRIQSVNRRFMEEANGPPYFYYEDLAPAPKDVWDRISRFLYNTVPEFMDSKYIAAARERGYVHNLPIDNRSPLLPLPPKTIFGAFPHSQPWWPSWDNRTQLNCLHACMADPKLIKHIHRVLACSGDIPPLRVQEYVMEECRKLNLIWVGKNRVAPLEPQDMEYLLGFPSGHTRGFTKMERYESLGNSFQVDTVAYHLSVLKEMFPNGMNVLSLFSGIGGGEIALHKLGIHMKTVISVEISQISRDIFRNWWEETQSGTLVQIDNVRSLSDETIKALIREHGGFDLVIGGNACNYPTGSNRDELDRKQASLFYQYERILKTVRTAMRRL